MTELRTALRNPKRKCHRVTALRACDLIAWVLQPNPEHRPQTFEQVLDHSFFAGKGGVWKMSLAHVQVALSGNAHNLTREQLGKRKHPDEHPLGKSVLHVATLELNLQLVKELTHELLSPTVDEEPSAVPRAPLRSIRGERDQVPVIDESGNSPLHTLLSATFEQDEDLVECHEICKQLADVTDFELTNLANKTVLALGVASECPGNRDFFEAQRYEQARTIRFARFLGIVAPNEGEWVEPWALGEHGLYAGEQKQRDSFQAWLESRANQVKRVEVTQQATMSLAQKKNQTARELRWRTIDNIIESLAGFSGPRFLTEYVDLAPSSNGAIVRLKEEDALARPVNIKDYQWKQILKSFKELIGGQDKMAYYYLCLLASSERRTLLEDYVFKKKIGSGSFSQVNLCDNRHSGCQDQRRAVKIVVPEGGEHGQHFKDAQTEIALQQRVSTSDYVLKIFAWGIAGDMLWVAMEDCDLGELHGHLERERGMQDVRLRNEWVSQLAHGLQHMHGLRILHRDINPGKSRRACQ